jgi:hypothetical protein
MAPTPPLTIRVTNRTLLAFLEWLRERDQKQSDFLKEWVETGFSLWLVKTAVLDPGLYAEIVGRAADLEPADELRTQGIEALRDTLHLLLSGLGGLQPARSSGSDLPVSDGETPEAFPLLDDEIVAFLDIGDETEQY